MTKDIFAIVETYNKIIPLDTFTTPEDVEKHAEHWDSDLDIAPIEIWSAHKDTIPQDHKNLSLKTISLARACRVCKGDGGNMDYYGGMDNLEPPEFIACPFCRGKGWLIVSTVYR